MTELSTQTRDYPTDETGITTERADVIEEAFTNFYPEIVSYLRRRGAGDDAEDLAQETFVRAFRYQDTYREGNLAAWLYTLAKNAQIDHYRKSSRRPVDFTDDVEMLDRVAPDYTSNPLMNLFRDELLAQVTSTVTADQADTYLLREQGYSNTEISEIHQVPRGTVRSRISRGGKALKAAGIKPA